ncbi:MAG: SelB C-terminal domain-containing protein, partial [Actinobacteria bacterium]|nr:SelB C-terminal domain-containing protein [Actinomycetota bacterium]
LPGVSRGELRRGDALVTPGAFPVGYRLDIALEELAPITDGARLYVHHGTAAVPARVVRVGERHAQLRLAAPVVAARGDRLVLRGETTVGGGIVIDAAPPRHADPGRFERAERGETAVHAPVLVDGDWVFADEWLDELRLDLERRLAAADPLDPGVDAPVEPWARHVLPRLPFERRGSKLYLPGSAPSLGEHAAAAAALEAELEAAAPATVRVEDGELARYLEREGRLVRLGDGHAVSTGAYERARAIVLEECAGTGRITLARFRDLAGCGRRDAQLLLERLDADGVTRRVGDERVVRRSASRSA